MAITFDLSKIKKYEKVCLSSDSARSWTDTFIYATLTLQMGDITEQNWKEWTNVTWSKLYVDQQKKNMLAFIDKAHSDNENARLRRNAAARKRHAAKKAARTNNETK